MSEPYQISITKTGDAIVCSVDMWRDVQEKIGRFFAERTEEEAVRQLREIGFERVVRCRDCRYMHTVRSWLGMDVDECWLHVDPESGALGKERTEPNGFCAWGERRGD